MKVDPSVETYQVGAHFKALIKDILVAPSRILENFFFISCLPAALCKVTMKICTFKAGYKRDRPDLLRGHSFQSFHEPIHSAKYIALAAYFQSVRSY